MTSKRAREPGQARATAIVEPKLRNSGLAPIGDLPWGMHLCLFYDTPRDLIDVHARYFAAGLEAGEACVWALSPPLDRDVITRGLQRRIPGLADRFATGQMELVPGYEWYLHKGRVDPRRITRGWLAKLDAALSKGFAGLRVSGNAFWFATDLWPRFRRYEAALDRSLAGRPMLILCTYPINAARAVDILDVARTHHFSIARRKGHWEFLETPELARARRKIGQLNAAIDILSRTDPRLSKLTPRERVVLAQIVRGASAKETARDLAISHRTVEFHRANILHKLGARNVAALVGSVLRAPD